MEAVSYVEVGPEGERIDKRDYVTDWEKVIREAVVNDPIIMKVQAGDLLNDNEEQQLANRLNQPEHYFNEENLRRAYRNPGGSLVDFIRAALGQQNIKSRTEIVEENFHAWLVTHNLSADQAQYLALLKNRGIARGNLVLDDLFEPPLSILNAANLGIELFGEKGLKKVVEDMNETLFMNQRL